MKKILFSSMITGTIIIGALIFGSLRNDAAFYHSLLFLLLLALFCGLTLSCLILRRKAGLDYWLIHSGFLIILSGALISFLFSYRQFLEVKEGEKKSLPGTDLSIRLDKFDLKYYSDGTPREYKSALSLFKNGHLIKEGKTLVNHPFSYKGFKIYQASYGTGEVALVVGSKGREFVFKEIGDEVLDEKSGLRLKLIDFLPDFVIMDGRPSSRSEEFNNPALKLTAYQGDEPKESGWLFLNFKDFHQGEKEVLAGLSFEDIATLSYFSGLEVVKDHGAKLAFLGSSLMLLGLARRFYF